MPHPPPVTTGGVQQEAVRRQHHPVIATEKTQSPTTRLLGSNTTSVPPHSCAKSRKYPSPASNKVLWLTSSSPSGPCNGTAAVGSCRRAGRLTFSSKSPKPSISVFEDYRHRRTKSVEESIVTFSNRLTSGRLTRMGDGASTQKQALSVNFVSSPG